MDKNSIWGMILMAALIFGFMWLNQPSDAEIARQRELAEQQLQQNSKLADNPDVLTLDSVSEAEVNNIKAMIERFGTTDSTDRSQTLDTKDAHLTLRDGEPGGYVVADGQQVPLTAILSRSYEGISRYTASQAVSNLKKALADVAKYKGFARYLSGDSTTVSIENDVLSLEISNKGGAIARATLKDYQRYDSSAVTLFEPGLDSYNFTLTSANRRFDTREFYFTPVAESDSTVVMMLDLGDGARFGIRYTLPQSGYLVRMDIVQEGMDAVVPTSVSTLDLNWVSKMQRNESGRMFEERNSALYYMYANGDVENLAENSSETKEITERLRWVGYKNQFFSAVLISATNFTSAQIESEVLENNRRYLKNLKSDMTVDYSSTKANPASFFFYLGPNSYPLLSDIQKEIIPDDNMHLTDLIPLGWSLFRWINTWIVIPVFDILGKWISNYGIIILLLTIFIKIILFPFTYKSYISQAKMRVLSPEIKEINDKYPGNENAMKRQQETMALYSRAGASPFSGCLPLLLQMPILIAMFNFFPSAIELRGQSFLWAKDLSAPDAIVSWTTNIPFISGTFGNHISLFCLLMTVVNIVYTKITMQSQPGGNTMPGMKWMTMLMPLMFLVFFNNYAAGLSYYYLLSLLITILQTYIFRRVINEEKVRETMKQNARKPKKKSGFMARLEEAQRRQQAILREQEKKNGKGQRRR